MATVNDFKFEVGQKVNAWWRGMGVVISQQRRAGGNSYEIKINSNDNVDSVQHVGEHELSTVAAPLYPCPGGIRAFVIHLNDGRVEYFRENDKCYISTGPHHHYRWNEKDGVYYISYVTPLCLKENRNERPNS